MRWLKRLLWEEGRSLGDVAVRLDCTVDDLRNAAIEYRAFSIPKRDGGRREVLAPCETLKVIQRRINRRLLRRLRAHPAATGFERGHSIVSNARFHEGQAVVIRMDVKSFFARTKGMRVRKYFVKIGWGGEAADVLTRLCTYRKSLLPGAPTSPRLANLVNYAFDLRLQALADRVGARYSRYADDITFSLAVDDGAAISTIIRYAREIAQDFGYVMHRRKKFSVVRRHQQQKVTGLVVNERARLPRETRRWLRAVEHHQAMGRPMTLTPTQLAGWRAFRRMVEGP